MKSTRHLALRRETLTELTDNELTALAGGVTLTLQAGCSVDETTAVVRETLLTLTLMPRCSWSCI